MDIWDRKEDMNCKEFEKLIPDFIGKRMSYPALRRFQAHMEQCEACREELNIQFLVTEGIRRLEDGNAFDLQSELRQRLEETRKKIRFHGVFLYMGIAMEIAGVALLMGIVVWILL